MGEKIPVAFVWLFARLECNKEIEMESKLFKPLTLNETSVFKWYT